MTKCYYCKGEASEYNLSDLWINEADDKYIGKIKEPICERHAKKIYNKYNKYSLKKLDW